MTWNGKADSISHLVADVEYPYVKPNPIADCTVIGVLQVINKLRAKNIQLADSLNKIFPTPKRSSKGQQKIICIDCVLSEKALASPQQNLQPHKKNNHRISDVQGQEDALELLVVDVQKVVIKAVSEVEVAEEEATIKVQAIGNLTEGDHLALAVGEIVAQVLVKEEDILNQLAKPSQDHCQE